MAMPTAPEQLRLRLTVMYNALAMIKLKHTGWAELADISADLFENLLGDYVYGLRSAAMIPPWTPVLGYEHAIRKLANKLVSQKGYKIGEALKKAWKAATIKERHFISPLSLYGKRATDPPPAPPAGAEKPGKGGKKGGKKGFAKGNKGQPHTWPSGKGSSRTPDNKPICFRYNAKCGCKKGTKCHFAHVCSTPVHRWRQQGCRYAGRECLTRDASRGAGGSATDGAVASVVPFLGAPRRWDMQSCLKQLCATEGLNLDMLCVDIKRRPWIDLSNTKEREKLLEQIRQGKFDAIILSPPCSTFSRACWANRKGPGSPPGHLLLRQLRRVSSIPSPRRRAIKLQRRQLALQRTPSRYANRKARESWVELVHRESATFQGVREIPQWGFSRRPL